MRILFIGLLLYLLFLVQVIAVRYSQVWPDIVLLTVLVAALHETRFAATLLGIVAGFFLDLTVPANLGANMLGLGLVGYVASAARGYFYPAPWFFPLLVAGALMLRMGVAALTGMPLSPLVLQAASSVLTVGISLPVRHVLKCLFYRRHPAA